VGATAQEEEEEEEEEEIEVTEHRIRWLQRRIRSISVRYSDRYYIRKIGHEKRKQKKKLEVLNYFSRERPKTCTAIPVSKNQDIMGCMGSGGTATRTLNIEIRWK
jgi:hypothetical protein